MKRLLRGATTFAVALLAIELGARWNIRREQEARAPLGDRLHAEIAGTRGDPIVFIAGLQGSTRYWNRAFDLLSTNHRVIYVDLLGFGRSPWPDGEYSLDDHLDALRRTLQSLGATRNVTFVAHSFGAIVASYYAARHPGDVRRLVLLGTPVYASAKEARARIRAISPLAAAFSFQPFLARETCLLMEAVRPLSRRLAPYAMPRLPRAVAEDTVLHTWWSFRGAMNNVLLSKPVEWPLRVIGAKTVMVHGTRDVTTPVARIQSLAKETGASVVLVACDHHGYVPLAAQWLPVAFR